MEDEKYLKTLFKRNTNIQVSDDSGKDVIFITSKGQDELFNIVRDTLLEKVNGSCIYSCNDNEVYFSVSKSDMNVLEAITKKIKRDRRIHLTKVLINTKKVNSYLHKKDKG